MCRSRRLQSEKNAGTAHADCNPRESTDTVHVHYKMQVSFMQTTIRDKAQIRSRFHVDYNPGQSSDTFHVTTIRDKVQVPFS